MVVKNGFIKLIDFEAEKSMNDRANTIIDTPDYMAPGVILSKGYSFKVYFRSITIMTYEFL